MKINTIIVVMFLLLLSSCEVDQPTYPLTIEAKIIEPNQTSQIYWGNRELLVRWQGIEADTVSLILFYYQTAFLTLAENIPNNDSAIVLLPFMNQYSTGAHYSISLIGHDIPVYSEPINIQAWSLPSLDPVRELSIGTEYHYQHAYMGGGTGDHVFYRIERDTIVEGKTYYIQSLNGTWSYLPPPLLRVDSTSFYKRNWGGSEYEIYNIHWNGDIDENRTVALIQNVDVLGNLESGLLLHEFGIAGFEPYDNFHQVFPGLGIIARGIDSWSSARYLIAVKIDGVMYGDTTRYSHNRGR